MEHTEAAYTVASGAHMSTMYGVAPSAVWRSCKEHVSIDEQLCSAIYARWWTGVALCLAGQGSRDCVTDGIGS